MVWNIFSTHSQNNSSSMLTEQAAASTWMSQSLSWVSQTASTAGQYLWNGTVATFSVLGKGLRFVIQYGNNLSYTFKLWKNAIHKHPTVEQDIRSQLTNPKKSGKQLNKTLIKFSQNLAANGTLLNKLTQEQQIFIKRLSRQSRTPLFHVSKLNDLELNQLIHFYEKYDHELNLVELELANIDYHSNQAKKSIAVCMLSQGDYAAYAPSLFAITQGLHQGYKYWYQGKPVHAQEALFNFSKQAVFTIPTTLAWNYALGDNTGIFAGFMLQMISSTKWYNKIWDPKRTLTPEKYQWLNDYYTQLSSGSINQAQETAHKLSTTYGIEVEDEALLALVEDLSENTIHNRMLMLTLQGCDASLDSTTRESYLELLKNHFQIDLTKPYVTEGLLHTMNARKNTQGYDLVKSIGLKIGSYQDPIQKYAKVFAELGSKSVVPQYQNQSKIHDAPKDNSPAMIMRPPQPF